MRPRVQTPVLSKERKKLFFYLSQSWCMLIIPALGSLRQKDLIFKTYLGYIATSMSTGQILKACLNIKYKNRYVDIA
jgi:hypothetical protein